VCGTVLHESRSSSVGVHRSSKRSNPWRIAISLRETLRSTA
jgi:hypothetical protein